MEPPPDVNRHRESQSSSSGGGSDRRGPKPMKMDFVVHISKKPKPVGWPKRYRGSLTPGVGSVKAFESQMRQIYGGTSAMLEYKVVYIGAQPSDPMELDFNGEEGEGSLNAALRKFSELSADPKIECHAWYPDPADNSRSNLARRLSACRVYIHPDVMAGCFVPEEKLTTILEKPAIKEFFEEEVDSQNESSTTTTSQDLDSFVSDVFSNGKRLFATFLIANIGAKKFKIAWKKGQRDSNLPYSRENHDALYLEPSEKVDVFLMQWQTRAVVFERLAHGDAPRKYAKECLLPILEQEALGVGSYGSVSKIRIQKSHQKLYRLKNVSPELCHPTVQHATNCMQRLIARQDDNPWLALKEFRRSTRVIDWDREFGMLKQITLLKHPHLIGLLTAFRHGEDCYLILPLAKCSLEDLLTNEEPDRKSRRYVLWMLRQMEGLAGGLREFHGLDAADSLQDFHGWHAADSLNPNKIKGRRLAYHHDIKPANILLFKVLEPQEGSEALKETGLNEWEKSYGRLQIADLGLGKIREPDEETHTRTLKGTPTYAAPETDGEKVQGVQADIWALACVFLEVMVWLMEGHEGLERFNNARFVLPSAE